MSDPARSSTHQSNPLDRLARAESDLAAIQNELEHTQRLATLGTLAAAMAHEINNVLTPALAYAQMAKSNPHDEELMAKVLVKTISGIETAAQIAGAMVGFSTAPEQASTASLDEVLETVRDCLPRRLLKGVVLSIHAQPGIRVSIRPLALQQVLLNLVLNACKALEGHGGEVAITAVEHEDGTTLITVADTGPGIPETVAASLFEPFVTSRRTAAEGGRAIAQKSGGAGLGLAVCKHLVSQAGGSIAVASKPGRGATFRIVLPTADRLPNEAA
jgi:signal transduction histidine kinase